MRTRGNPSDPASRGVDPSKLENLSIWWFDPDWLKTHESFVPFKPQGTKMKKISKHYRDDGSIIKRYTQKCY